MRFSSRLIFGAVLPAISILCLPGDLRSQQPDTNTAVAAAALPEAPEPQNTSVASPSSAQSQPASQTNTPPTDTKNPPAHKPPPQPKRILGIMPNYRAVSAGEIPPPPTPREAFVVATKNSFDYSAFVFVGLTSLLAEGTGAHPQLGKGVSGYWAYYWRGYLDKTDGNYWVDWAMPTVFHQDERYYAMGEGNVFKRSIYAASRELITPNYHGKNSFNASEILGRGISQAISLTYYPSQTRTVGGFTEKYAYAVGRDALTNVFREVWPDINQRLFHRHH
ncbi:MAG TPA: hypothetical protein VMT38_09425 [Terracidiphilus sp.]|nr:hypothetical protein [Terracidiphilus sp.]